MSRKKPKLQAVPANTLHNPGVKRITGIEVVCPACRRLLDPNHSCVPDPLRNLMEDKAADGEAFRVAMEGGHG